MRLRIATAAAVTGLVALTAPMTASAATPPPPAPSAAPIRLSFVPPRVGAITVDLGKTIINGQVISPGLHVVKPEVTLTPDMLGGDGATGGSHGHSDAPH
jgi:hypothetical protein